MINFPNIQRIPGKGGKSSTQYKNIYFQPVYRKRNKYHPYIKDIQPNSQKEKYKLKVRFFSPRF